MTRTVVTIGAGQTAAIAARTLRRRGFDGRIVLVGGEPHPPYQRPPLSKEYLQTGEDRDELFLLSEQWCDKNDVELRLGVRAVGLNPGERAVELGDGSRVVADTVLFATGGRPRLLPNAPSERVLYLRTLDDAERLRAFLEPGRHIVVVGGGFIGSEVAASARSRGADVTVLEMLDVPLQGVLGREMGEVCAGIHRTHGVDMRVAETVESVTESTNGVRVRTRGGADIEGDVVVAGIGIEPNVDVAESAGIKVDNGIVVDEYCRTSVDGVFAAGDVANHFHPLFGRRIRVEHFDNANKQAAAAAKNMLGTPTVFDDPHWFWSDQYKLNLQYVGHADRRDTLVVRGSTEALNFTTFYLRDGIVRAAFAVDRGDEIAIATEMVAAELAADPAKLRDEDIDLAELLPET